MTVFRHDELFAQSYGYEFVLVFGHELRTQSSGHELCARTSGHEFFVQSSGHELVQTSGYELFACSVFGP